MRHLSEADLKAINEAPCVLFLVEIEAPGFSEPIRVAQVDIVSSEKRYTALPITFDTAPDDPLITVRGSLPFRSLVDAIDGAPATVRVIFEALPDEPIQDFRGSFHAPPRHDAHDVVGYLILFPERKKTRPLRGGPVGAFGG